MDKKFGAIGSLFGMLAVAIGAFGAHSLKAVLTDYQLDIFKTAVQYQFFHVLAILIIAILIKKTRHLFAIRAAQAFVIGILLFSGSLYLLACKDLIGISNTSIIGPLTPIGGLALMIGWLLLFIGFIWNRK